MFGRKKQIATQDKIITDIDKILADSKISDVEYQALVRVKIDSSRESTCKVY